MTLPIQESVTMRALHHNFIALKLNEFLGRNVHMAYLANPILNRGNSDTGLLFKRGNRFSSKDRA